MTTIAVNESEMLNKIISQYEQYCEKYGASAPDALLRYTQRAPHNEEPQAQAVTEMLKHEILQRCRHVFEAQHWGENAEHPDPVQAYEACAERVRLNLLRVKCLTHISAPGD
jgi:hypothetical protein